MRRILAAALALLALGAAPSMAADPYPVKPIRWITPWAPGGANDILSRAIGNELMKSLGQPVVVENRPGATGTIGTNLVAKAPPDGYTLTLGAPGTHTTAPVMVPDLPYDPVRDFTPISLVAVVPNVLVVNPALPVHSVKELVVYAKDHPGKLNFSSVGSGSMQHLSGELFQNLAKVEMTHVPYKGSAPALLDLTAGRIDLAFESMPTVLPHVRSGGLRALAVTTKRRSGLLPDVPTVDEAGLPGFDVTIWYGVFGPAGMPPEIVRKLNAAIVAAIRTPELSRQLADLGADKVGSSPEELGAYLQQESAKWTGFMKAANIKPD